MELLIVSLTDALQYIWNLGIPNLKKVTKNIKLTVTLEFTIINN